MAVAHDVMQKEIVQLVRPDLGLGALDRLEAFASRNGPAFYGLPLNQRTVTLRRESWQVPEKLAYSEDVLIPLRAGQALGWRLVTAD